MVISMPHDSATLPEGGITPGDQDLQIPGAFMDDVDFTATIVAGLQHAGFDPNIVVDDPSYRRRDSPPGVDHESCYRRPVAETVSDLGLEPSVYVIERDDVEWRGKTRSGRDRENIEIDDARPRSADMETASHRDVEPAHLVEQTIGTGGLIKQPIIKDDAPERWTVEPFETVRVYIVDQGSSRLRLESVHLPRMAWRIEVGRCFGIRP